MSLKLRQAISVDIPALTQIQHRAKAAWDCPEDRLAENRKYESVTEDLVTNQHVVVVERDNQPVAFSAVTPGRIDTLVITCLFVDPTVQKSRLGTLLLKRAEDFARTHGLARLYVESDFHAERFYESHGFKVTGRQPSKMIPDKTIPLMEKILPAPVHKISSIDLAVSSAPWSFEVAHEQEIDAHFNEICTKNPHLWNGRTLKLTGYTFKDGCFEGVCAECSYAAFLAWRDWGAPDPTAFNIFGSAVLRSSDGALLYGVMSARTAMSGFIYPPGGNLDPTDLTTDGKIDINGAIYRELEEETGLNRQDVVEGELLIAFDGPRISISRVFEVNRPAHDLRNAINAFSRASKEQELADIRIIRSKTDLGDPAIVTYARMVGDYLLTV